MFTHVIVPVDLSHENAAYRALQVARANLAPGGKLTLLHVIAPIPGYVAVEAGFTASEKVTNSAMSQLQSLAERDRLASDTDLRIEHGSIYRKILECVTDPDHQAIVMASHNPRFSDFMIGSVAAQVVKHAKCSVFVVRHSQ